MTDSPTPGWVRIADGIALGLLALAAWSVLTGGSRTEMAGVVVSTRSPWPLLYGSVSVLIVRHVLHGRPTARQRIRDAWTAVTMRPMLAAAVRAFLLTRPAVLLVGILAVGAFGFPRQPGFILCDDRVANLPGRFDAGWYGGIALDGYNWDHTFQRQRNIAFFPAMPLLMRPLGAVFGMYDSTASRERRMIRALWAGVVISLVAFLWALHYLVRLGSELVGDERAPTAALLLAAYPFSVFYSAPYTESLFLLGAVAACFHFRRQEWAAAMCWGLVAGLTRPNGCFLSVPLALMAFTLPRIAAGAESRTAGVAEGPSIRWKAGPAVRLFVAAAPVIGMLIFTAYLYGLSGVWFAWARSHAAWGRTFQGLAPFVTFFSAMREQSLLQVFASSPFNSLNGLGVLFATVMVWPVVRHLGVAWGVFMLVNLMPPFFAGGVVSMGRLTSTLFPIFLALSILIPPRQVAAWAAAFGIGQGLVATLFFTWRELY